MATGNFNKKNASKVFAVLMDKEVNKSICNDCGEEKFEWEEGYICSEGDTCSTCGSDDVCHEVENVACDDFEVEDFKSYIREVAEETATKEKITYTKEEGGDNDRNFYGQYLFCLTKEKNISGIDLEFNIRAKLVSGYYEGACLDYEIGLSVDGYDYNEDYLYEIERFEDSDLNSGMIAIQKKNALKWCEKTHLELIDVLEEKIFKAVSMPLVVVGIASNGETFYKQTNK